MQTAHQYAKCEDNFFETYAENMQKNMQNRF